MKIFKRKHKTLCIDVTIRRKKMNYYWRRFTYLVELSYQYNKNSEKYNKINKLAWVAFDRWSSLFLQGYTEEENNE